MQQGFPISLPKYPNQELTKNSHSCRMKLHFGTIKLAVSVITTACYIKVETWGQTQIEYKV